MSETSEHLALREALTEFRLDDLFIEQLGWDQTSPNPIYIEVDGATVSLSPVAEKRGVVRVPVREPRR